MQETFTSAREISEHLLDVTGNALMNRDFSSFKPHFQLPQHIATFQGERYIETEAEFHRVFDAVCAHFEKSGVTDMVRHCVEASFQDEKTVVATHESRLVNRNVITQAPFPVLSILKFNGNAWQIVSSSYAIADCPDHNAALLAASASG